MQSLGATVVVQYKKHSDNVLAITTILTAEAGMVGDSMAATIVHGRSLPIVLVECL